jgi:hypothetical protein
MGLTKLWNKKQTNKQLEFIECIYAPYARRSGSINMDTNHKHYNDKIQYEMIDYDNK